jgi:hypothetical protein
LPPSASTPKGARFLCAGFSPWRMSMTRKGTVNMRAEDRED